MPSAWGSDDAPEDDDVLSPKTPMSPKTPRTPINIAPLKRLVETRRAGCFFLKRKRLVTSC